MILTPNLDDIFGKLKLLKIFDFYKSRKLTEEQTQWLDALCRFYLVCSPRERAEINRRVESKISFLFFLYGNTAAVEAVRETNAEKVKLGLAALAIENGVFDWRDSLFVLVKLYHSAKKINLDPVAAFRQIAEIAGPESARFFLDFLARPPEICTITTFGFKEGTDSNGLFAYLAT
jgi:hypothetical protein